MNRTCRTLLAVLAIALLAAPSFAQDPLASKVTVDLKAVSPDQAFRVVGNTIGMKVTVDPKVTTPIDILVRDVTARTALTTMCESIGCRWTVSDNVLSVTPADPSAPTTLTHPATVSVIRKQTDGSVEQKKLLLERLKEALKQPLPADMRFENAPLSEVSARLSEALGLTVTLMSENPALKSVTADFSSKTLMAALKALGDSGSNPPPLRLAIAARGTPGGPVPPSIMIGMKFAPKKK